MADAPVLSIPSGSSQQDILRDLKAQIAKSRARANGEDIPEDAPAAPSTADMAPPPRPEYRPIPNVTRPAQRYVPEPEQRVPGYKLPEGTRADLPDDSRASRVPAPEPERSFPSAAQVGARMPGSVAIDRSMRLEGVPEAPPPDAPIRLQPPAPPAGPVPPPRKPLQQVEAESRQRQANSVDPAVAEGRAAGAVESYRNGRSRRDYRQEAQAADEAAALTQDTAAFERAMQVHDARRMQLESQLDDAVRAGNIPRQQALREQLAAHQESAPTPSLRMTGGRTPEELDTTVEDSMLELTPSERAALQSAANKYATGQDGKVSAERAKEWIWGQFSDLPPTERLAAMKEAAAREANPMPAQMPTRTGGVAGGRGSKVGDQAEKKSAEAASRTDNDRRNGGYPVGKNAGMMVQNPNGSYSSRAPRVDQMDAVAGEGGMPDPNPDAITPEWRNQMLAIGQNAFGLQRDAYAPGVEGDNMLIADAQEKLARHNELLAAGYEAKPVITGGYRYVAVKGGKADEMTKRAQRQARTRDFLKLNAVPQDVADAMWKEADGGVEPSAETKVRREKDNAVRNTLSDDREMQQWARRFQNPAIAMQMLRRSLREAGTDPEAQASVFDQFGMHDAADRVRMRRNELALTQHGAALKERELAVAEGKNKPEDPTAGQAMNITRDESLAQLDENGVDSGLARYSVGHNQIAAQSNGAIKPHTGKGDAVIPLAAAVVAHRDGLSNPNRRAVVDRAVKSLYDSGPPGYRMAWGSEAEFVSHVVQQLGDTPNGNVYQMAAMAWRRNRNLPSGGASQAAPVASTEAPGVQWSR